MNNIMKNLKRKTAVLLSLVFCFAACMTVFAEDGMDAVDLHAGAGEVIHAEVDEQFAMEFAKADTQAEAQQETQKDVESDLEQENVVEPEVQIVMANVKDSLNVREEANEEAKAVGKLYKNCGGVILERKGGWTYLESGKLKGWAKDEYLLFGEEAEELQQEVGTLKATVKTDALRIRKEASEEAGVYGLLKNGQTIKAKEELGEWVAVYYDKDTVGYVAAEYVDVEFSVEKGKTNEQIKEEEAEKAKKKLNENRGAVAAGVSDVTLLAALIQCEAGSEPYEGKLAVGAVVMNRVRSGRYPGGIQGAIYAKGQFPPAANGRVAAIAAKGPSASCIQAAQAAISGQSNVGGATCFRRAGSHPGIVIGNHVFW